MHNKNRKIMFMSRKAQITISFLLIFFILFSVFSIALFASREAWASAKFKGVVDAASLSAGADMAKGASLFIKVTAVRLVSFGISTLLYILSIPFPSLLATATSVGNFSKNISKALGQFSKFIPLIYTVKAEVDAYTTFRDNFTVNDQGSSNDFGIIVIPTHSIDKVIGLVKGESVNFDLLPLPNNLDESIDMLKKGVTVFGYRKYSYLEQIKNNLNIGNTYSNLDKSIISKVGNWINTHDFIISSSTICKTDPSTMGGGIDVSDALKISKFLDSWDSGESEIEKDAKEKGEDEAVKNIIDDILEQASNVVDTVRERTPGMLYIDGDPCKLESYPDKAVCKANEIKQQVKEKEKLESIDKTCLNDLENKLHEWINFCRQGITSGFLKGAEDGKKFAFNVSNMRENAYVDNDNSLESIINKCREILQKLESNEPIDTKISEVPPISNLVDKIKQIRDCADKSEDILERQLKELPDTGTCTTQEKEEITINLAPTKNPMRIVLNNLKKISEACNSAVNNIEVLSKQFDKITKNAVDKSADSLKNNSIFNSMIEKAGDAATAFKGLPGGNFLAYIVNPEGYDCSNCKDCDAEKELISIYSACGILGTVGKFACAIAKDINLTKNLLSGDLEFTSYYSAKLSIPDWIGTSTLEIQKYKTIDDVLNGLLEGVKNSLKIDLGEDKGDYLKLAAASACGSIISGVLSGGVSVIVGAIITTAVEAVIKPLLKDLIVNKLFPYLEKQVTEWVNDLRKTEGGAIITEIENSLSTFVDVFNEISTLKLRLIGSNFQPGKSDNNLAILLCFLIPRAAPDKEIISLKDKNENSYILF